MVGHGPLKPSILVRVQVPQHEEQSDESRDWTRTWEGVGKREFPVEESSPELGEGR